MKNLKSTLAAKVTALRAMVAISLVARCNSGCKGCNRAFRRFWTAITPVGKPVLVGVNDSEAETGHISACNETVSPDQEWTRIAPYRAIPNEVGLQVFDRAGAEAMVTAFNSVAGKVSRLFRGIPAFVGHPDHPAWAKENPQIVAKYGTEAYGRIKALEARDDGLYGKVIFNDDGKRLVSGEAAPFAFHSPRWSMLPATHQGQKAFRPVLLHSIGLTNNPNISGNAIGLNEAVPAFSPTMKIHIIALLAALGRPIAADSTDEQLAAAVNEATPVATALVTASNELGTLKPQLITAQNEIVTLKGKVTTAEGLLTTEKTNAINERAARADAVLTVAVNEGRITEAQRPDWKTKLTTATDFGAVQGEIVKLKPAVNTKGKAAVIGARKEEVAASNDMITAINTAVQTHIKTAGLDPVKDYSAAYDAVRKAQPALFTATA